VVDPAPFEADTRRGIALKRLEELLVIVLVVGDEWLRAGGLLSVCSEDQLVEEG
jgi:hypothetical protein